MLQSACFYPLAHKAPIFNHVIANMNVVRSACILEAPVFLEAPAFIEAPAF
jgi:hypothetical protein